MLYRQPNLSLFKFDTKKGRKTMILAKKIRMKSGCYSSNSLLEIDEIYLEGKYMNGFYKKGAVYDSLISSPHSIQVDHSPYPYLLPALSSRGEKYVRSEANDSTADNLLKLPRV